MATTYTFNINYNGEDQSLVLAKELCNWTNFIGLLNEKLSMDNNKMNYSIHYFDKEKNKKYLVEAHDFEILIFDMDDMKQTQVTLYYGQDHDNLINGWVFAPNLDEINNSNGDNNNNNSNNNNNDQDINRSDYATTFHEWGKLMDKHHALIQKNPYINMLTSRFSHALIIYPNVTIVSSLDLWLTHYNEHHHDHPSSYGRKHRHDFIASLPRDIGDYLMSIPHPGRRHHHHHQRGSFPPPPSSLPLSSDGPFDFWSNLFTNFGTSPSSSSQEKENCSIEKGKQHENVYSSSSSHSTCGFTPGDHPFGLLFGMSKHCKKAMKMRIKDYYLQQYQQLCQQQQKKNLHPCYTTSGHNESTDGSSSGSSSSSSSSESSENENEKQSFRDDKNNNEFSPRMQAKFWKLFAKQYRREYALDGNEHIKHHKKRHACRHHRRHHNHHPSPPQEPTSPFDIDHHHPHHPHHLHISPPPFPGFEFTRRHHHHHHHTPPPPPGYMETFFSQMNLNDSKKH